jgi:hypothetical protein
MRLRHLRTFKLEIDQLERLPAVSSLSGNAAIIALS